MKNNNKYILIDIQISWSVSSAKRLIIPFEEQHSVVTNPCVNVVISFIHRHRVRADNNCIQHIGKNLISQFVKKVNTTMTVRYVVKSYRRLSFDVPTTTGIVNRV